MGSYVSSLVSAIHGWTGEQGVEITLYGPELLDVSVDVKQLAQPDLKYFSTARDPRLYDGFLFKVVESDSLGVICRLTMPEYLYSDLTNRSEYSKAQLMFSMFNFELASKSVSRARLLTALSDMDQICKIFVHGIRGSKPVFPRGFDFSDAGRAKVRYTTELDYQSHSNTSPDLGSELLDFAMPSHGFRFLYFGNMFYGKGLDLLFSAMSLVPDDFSFIVAGDHATSNSDMSIPKRRNLRVIDRFVSDAEMASLFRFVDVVVMPYRSTYEFGTSGVFHQALLAGKPVVVPNFSPFVETLEKFPVGVTFRADSSSSLAEGLKEIVTKIDDFDEVLFAQYKSEQTSWYEFSRMIVKEDG